MQKILFSFLLVILILYCFSQNEQGNDRAAQLKSYNAASKIYQQAEQLSIEAGDNEQLQLKSDEVYQEALSTFINLLPVVEKSGNDSLGFFIRLKTGFIHYYFDSITKAKEDYLAAISSRRKLPAIADSFLFLPYLYTGGIYYSQNEFDSALVFYKRAELVNDKYQRPLKESQRLYNRLGVMYYETGNYRQARNYFEKAITLTHPSDKNLLANYKINIGSILIKLEEYRSAQRVYESMLPYNVFNDEIYHNLAIISLKQKDYKKAISFLRKVNYTDNKRSIDLYYNFGVAYAALQEEDSSEFYLQRAITENLRWNGRRKNVPFGLILTYQADELARQQLYKEAAARYQQAILQFHTDFKDPDTDKNPENFTAVFSYINLFKTLTAKASALENWYQQDKSIEHLKASIAAYQSAFKLADYVERTYDSDEARLFLGKIKYTVHSRPIEISLLLYDITGQKNYLEEAYLFDQRNKASLLSLRVQEKELKNRPGSANEMLRQEEALKTVITRLMLKIPQTTDSNQLLQINSAIRDNEIQLGKLQDKLNDDPSWKQRKFVEQIPASYELQKELDNNTAVLSFHLSEKELLTLIITSNRFEYKKLIIDKNFFEQIELYKTSLHNTSGEQRYAGVDAATYLYKKLILPVQSKLPQIKRLIIIPDDELHYLPFEALQDEQNKFLIERFSIQYQYATALLGENKKTKWPAGILSFAPFSEKGYSDSLGSLSPLPASGEEIANLEGITFTDSLATKNQFLQAVNHYNIVHLATHASVNNEEPSLSFITFYPSNSDYKLYAQEIYDLRLDSTQLVILSACETGTGKLVKGEGLMSLSRAFAYAGCPNIITSLWKAEDKTTAFITQRLHYYLNKKYSKDEALQQAKIDLLKNKQIDPRLKSPNYWAHLIFIGNYERSQNSSNLVLVAIIIILGAVSYKLIKRKA